MAARGEEEDKEEVMADRVGREVAREARARYMVVACRWLQGRQVACRFVAGTARAGWAGWAWALLGPCHCHSGCHRRHWTGVFARSSLVGEAFGEPGYGRYDDPGSGFWVVWAWSCFPLGLGLGAPWFVLGWLHTAAGLQWMQYDTAAVLYRTITVRYGIA